MQHIHEIARLACDKLAGILPNNKLYPNGLWIRVKGKPQGEYTKGQYSNKDNLIEILNNDLRKTPLSPAPVIQP